MRFCTLKITTQSPECIVRIPIRIIRCVKVVTLSCHAHRIQSSKPLNEEGGEMCYTSRVE
jgi:hypothetical protein